MIVVQKSTKIYINATPTDMRKAIDTLAALVIDELQMNPQSDSLFIFYNRNRDKVKILYWNKNGFVLYYKRLEKGRFKFIKKSDSSTYTISKEQLSWLLAGLDFMLMNEFNHLDYSNYY